MLAWAAVGWAQAASPGMAVSPSPVEAPRAPTKIYKFQDGGTTAFSDIPPAKGPYVLIGDSCFACKVESKVNWDSTKLHLDAYGDVIEAAARQYALDPALVRAVIHAESGFNARAKSNKGALGLMQLMPATARQLGVVDALVPSHNIFGGAQYLASLLNQFKGDVSLATAAYNAGPGAVQKYAGIPPYAETQVYVKRVGILLQRYKAVTRG